MGNKQKQIVYAFIDSQNLNLGIKSRGWNLDFRKFYKYLQEKYGVDKAYIFIGQVEGDDSLYGNLQEMGYKLVLKPTTEYTVDGKTTVKGNVDAELVLYAAAKVYHSYDKAIIVTGDGDFYCLAEYLDQEGKLANILVPNSRYSKLLSQFDSYIDRVDTAKKILEYRKSRKPKGAKRSPKAKKTT